MEHIIGIDIGATNTRIALLNGIGEIKERLVIPSEMAQGKKFFTKVAVLAAELAKQSNAKAVGVGTAGQIDRKTGSYSPGLYPRAAWVGVPLQQIIALETGLPVYVDNDCKIAAYAEWKIGQGKQMTDFISLTLGTGIGGGIIINGRLVHGEFGLAGHLGHLSIDQHGPLCPCGNRGCLELYASGTAIGALASEIFGGTLDSRQAFQLADSGDKKALVVIETAGEALGRGLGGLANMLNPEAFILGGSILEWFMLLKPFIRKGFIQSTMHALRHTPILKSTLGGDGGIVGAALYAQENLHEQK